MKESGKNKILILFELLEYTENCLRKQYLAKHVDATPVEIMNHISAWYGQSEHFTDRYQMGSRSVNLSHGSQKLRQP